MPKPICLKPKLKAWRKVDDPLVQWITKTWQAKRYRWIPFRSATA
jgi:hypothetical protein